jgi:hypothetical protein
MFDDAFPNLPAGVAFASRIEREVTIAELASPRQNNESHSSDQRGAKNPSFTAFDVDVRGDGGIQRPRKGDSSAAAAASE